MFNYTMVFETPVSLPTEIGKLMGEFGMPQQRRKFTITTRMNVTDVPILPDDKNKADFENIIYEESKKSILEKFPDAEIGKTKFKYFENVQEVKKNDA